MEFTLQITGETKENPTLQDIKRAIDLVYDSHGWRFLILVPSDPLDGTAYMQSGMNDDDTFPAVEVSLNDESKLGWRQFSYFPKSRDEMYTLFSDYFLNCNAPDYLNWEENTTEAALWSDLFSGTKINLFKRAFKVVRSNSNEIYKGFGFHHLSDVTQYYVHPNNQSYKGTTSLCQPIGESISMFSLLLGSIMAGTNKVSGDYFASDDRNGVFIDFLVPDDWRDNGVIESNIFRYKALVSKDMIGISAYDDEDNFIDGNMEHLHPLYKLLPCFAVLLAREMEQDSDFKTLVEHYIESPAADTFVNIHEDFYQAHKNDENLVAYTDLSGLNITGMQSFSESYQVIKENKRAYRKKAEANIVGFPDNSFKDEYLRFIPNLPEEFKLPTGLNSVCSAVTAGDARAVLFHGPAGTGKTMSCKLVCQAIGLPIMDTVNCTENLDEFVLGKYIPEDDRIVFKESYVTKAIRDGGAVVFEEINFAKPQYLAFLNSLLDDNGFVRLDNGEVVKRHPNFRFFATMNLGYYGTKELNQALYNRFNTIVEIAALSDEAISKMLTVRVPECKDVVDKILGVYHKLKKKIEAEELDLVISPRNLENWARLAKYDGYISAAEKTIIPIAKCDRVFEETIRGILVLYKWN